MAARLAKRMVWTWTILREGPVHCGGGGTGAGVSFPKVVLSILYKITRRRAAVTSFGSSSRWDWTSIIKAEVTAENRPACHPC